MFQNAHSLPLLPKAFTQDYVGESSSSHHSQFLILSTPAVDHPPTAMYQSKNPKRPRSALVSKMRKARPNERHFEGKLLARLFVVIEMG